MAGPKNGLKLLFLFCWTNAMCVLMCADVFQMYDFCGQVVLLRRWRCGGIISALVRDNCPFAALFVEGDVLLVVVKPAGPSLVLGKVQCSKSYHLTIRTSLDAHVSEQK